MKQQKAITILISCIALFSLIASSNGIFSQGGNGTYEYPSIRGKIVKIYGKGLYQHMSADVAIQGIAQDYITLFLGIPLLLLFTYLACKGSFRGRFLLAGILNYFFVTYLFYMGIAMFNQLFLVYVILTGTSFFTLALVLFSFDLKKLPENFRKNTPVKFPGIFLICMSLCITFLWLGIVVPPLIDGTIFPDAVQHYTTLTVQALDLSIFLPISFLSGLLLLKKKNIGYLMAGVTLVFLTLLMIALVAKLIAMYNAGVNVVPAIYLIPAFTILAGLGCFLLLKNVVYTPIKSRILV
jgi:hypothetical protein